MRHRVDFIPLGNTTRTPLARCTRCRAEVEAASALNHTRQPRAGDVTICLECGHAMVFAADLTLIDPDPEKLRQIRADPIVRKFQAQFRNASFKAIHDPTRKNKR